MWHICRGLTYNNTVAFCCTSISKLHYRNGWHISDMVLSLSYLNYPEVDPRRSVAFPCARFCRRMATRARIHRRFCWRPLIHLLECYLINSAKEETKMVYSDLNAMIGKSTFLSIASKNGDFLCLFVFACYGQHQFLV